MGKQSSTIKFDGVKSGGEFVKFFRGYSTDGKPIWERRCICPTCIGLTSPIHFYEEENV